MGSLQVFIQRHSVWPLCAVLLALLASLQYRLWQQWQQIEDYEQKIIVQKQENQRLLARNQLIEWDIKDLKQGLEATEERARYDLGMVKEDEILYYFPQ
ncbi:hypothetical protein AXE65_07425 [Ventosimonas gracilis]|uniref:Cell division protein FtsB n=1 Tax=Ventosimonas gracilis TaxID=1680762 RepID=A0A139SI24_9GAMM|nr:septum formation initiator family protein [Ventosimonas gracilis]KXU34228.1 hypothetical protein AXE65_07425 [Ventosimonas gracilis]